MNTNPIDILLVDDSPTDVLMIKEALAEYNYKSITVLEDGVEALKYLRKESPYSDAIRPDLVVLDLNLPKKDGREVLEELKKDESLKKIPVVVLTTSSSRDDIEKAYSKNANCYVTKPGDYHGFSNAVKSIQHFWLCVASLPGKELNAN